MTEYLKYGIDLGTTNSCIARFDNNAVQILPNGDNMLVTPSVVRIEKNGAVRVGRKAYESILENADNVACEFKRLMGQRDRKNFAASGKCLLPEELSAEILKALLGDARRRTGESIDATVITVPAAFGQLQCEATQRAAKLAGLKQSPLLQEPIAAAVGYGISPALKDQRWMVFDLGGGTLDVAIISSKNGSLNVLTHRGDNQLGGKDIDRLIVEEILLPFLKRSFRVPDMQQNAAAYGSLIQRLHLLAEQAKIDLTLDERVLISLLDLGEDLDRNLMEGEVELSRIRLEELCMPLFSKAIGLARDALVESRLAGRDIDKILLVGGPTQMPLLRTMLPAELGAPIDLTPEPMTAVARGAAVWASSLERETVSIPVSNNFGSRPIKLSLAHNSVSAATEAQVWLKVDTNPTDEPLSLRIESESGHWDSGWLPYDGGTLHLSVKLISNLTCRFLVHARDRNGRTLAVEPESFAIRHGMTLDRPPLPHTISAEVARAGGRHLDPLFDRGTLLPCTVERSYQANKELLPKRPGERLTIKLWEGEVLKDPEANDWVGYLQISSEEIERRIPEGAEIQVSVRIDQSRLIYVSAHVPLLKQEFENAVYIPERDEVSMVEEAQTLGNELDHLAKRLSQIESSAEQAPVRSDYPIKQLNTRLTELRKKLPVQTPNRVASIDPDRAKRLINESKVLRGEIAQLEDRLDTRPALKAAVKGMNDWQQAAEDAVNTADKTAQKNEFASLELQARQARERENVGEINRVAKAFRNLHWRAIYDRPSYWSESFDSLEYGDHQFTDKARAKALLEDGRRFRNANDTASLRETVQSLWRLLPAEPEQESLMVCGGADIR